MYLLLRDNKQSGPYTCEQLREKGIKAYDLVWIEGKSAAWRYPSEVEELKPFSPIIEEQPFERFYKKPSFQEEQNGPRSNTTSTTIQPVKAEPVIKKIEKPAASDKPDNSSTPKKVYINFPASVTSAPPKEVTPDNEKPVSVPSQVTVATSVPPQPSFPSSAEKKWHPDSQLKTEPSGFPVAEKPNNRSLLTVLAAACILLTGVIIGLVFSYQSRIEKQKELEKLVAQMQQQQQQEAANGVDTNTGETTANEETPQTPPNSVDYSNSTASLGLPDQSPDNNPPARQRPATPVSKKQENKTQPAEEKLSIIIPTVLTEDDKPVRTLESNRKTIFQKVSVENNKYKTGVLGGINNLELKLTNNSAFQLEEVEVDVKYLGSEGKVVKTQTVYFTNVAPGEHLSVRVPKSNRGVSVTYSVKKINTKELGMAIAGN
jgi:type II secretory pathway pseudopilin PulG